MECIDTEAKLYTVKHFDEVYDINLTALSCSCPAFDFAPNTPCKHVMLLGLLGAKYAQHKCIWYGDRLDVPHDLECMAHLRAVYLEGSTQDDMAATTAQLAAWAQMHVEMNGDIHVGVSLEDLGYNTSEVAHQPLESGAVAVGGQDTSGSSCSATHHISSFEELGWDADGNPSHEIPHESSDSRDEEFAPDEESGTESDDDLAEYVVPEEDPSLVPPTALQDSALMSWLQKGRSNRASQDVLQEMTHICREVEKRGSDPDRQYVRRFLEFSNAFLSAFAARAAAHPSNSNSTLYRNVANRYGKGNVRAKKTQRRKSDIPDFTSIVPNSRKRTFEESNERDLLDSRKDTLENIVERLSKVRRVAAKKKPTAKQRRRSQLQQLTQASQSQVAALRQENPSISSKPVLPIASRVTNPSHECPNPSHNPGHANNNPNANEVRQGGSECSRPQTLDQAAPRSNDGLSLLPHEASTGIPATSAEPEGASHDATEEDAVAARYRSQLSQPVASTFLNSRFFSSQLRRSR